MLDVTSPLEMEIAVEEWLALGWQWFLHHGVKITVVAFLALFLHRFARRFIEKVVRKAVINDLYLTAEAAQKRADTLIRIFGGVFNVMVIVVAVLMVLQEVGIPIGPLLAGAGIVGLAIGFGGQYLIRDLIAGVFIILESQYRIGDVVSLDGTAGLVEDISLRKTTLRNLDGVVHHVPHGEVKQVSNLSKDFARVNLNVGISYSSDLQRVIDVVNKVGVDLAEDPDWKETFTPAVHQGR